jgi:hypothetical protein
LGEGEEDQECGEIGEVCEILIKGPGRSQIVGVKRKVRRNTKHYQSNPEVLIS